MKVLIINRLFTNEKLLNCFHGIAISCRQKTGKNNISLFYYDDFNMI
jgi:hypothetical protein